MSELKLRIEGLDEVEKAIARAPVLIHRGMVAGMKGALEMLRAAGAKYPRQRLGAKAAFKTARQRRGFFAKLRSGEIEVPYRRGQSPGSEKLGPSWETEIKGLATAIKGLVGPTASYSRFVVDEEMQTAMHRRTGWPTIQNVFKENQERVVRFFQVQIWKLLGRL